MLHQRLEEAALNSWPALQQVLFDGWIVRFAQGYTKRANCVTPLYGGSRDLTDKLAVCERLYADRGLPTIFRLTPHVTPPELDRALEKRQYVVRDPSLVLHLDLRHAELADADPAALRTEALDDWLDHYGRLCDAPPELRPAHRAILEEIPTERWLTVLPEDHTIVACGMGVLENDCFGLFDLVTASTQRNRGHATRMVSALLQRAREQGAHHAYLQVVAANAPARRLYAKFGFQEAYPYWYRIPRTIGIPHTAQTGRQAEPFRHRP